MFFYKFYYNNQAIFAVCCSTEENAIKIFKFWSKQEKMGFEKMMEVISITVNSWPEGI